MSSDRFDLPDMTPEQFTELVSNRSDEELADVIARVGTADLLDRVFGAMEERFLPERAEGVDASAQFVIRDQREEHPYVVRIVNGTCAISRGRTDEPAVGIATDVLNFCKLVTGKTAGTMLFMTGKLKLSGDIMFAQRLMDFFDRPSR